MSDSPNKPGVLFVCIANSCRSQMAEGFAKALFSKAWDVWSAGSSPGGSVHPVAAELMREEGIDLSGHHSKGVDAVPKRTWDYVVSMGCGDSCPQVPARHHLDWDTPDPVSMPIEQARAVRDRIRSLVERLLSGPER